MNESIITWNVPNFITVSLMGGLTLFLFFFLSKAIRGANGG
jgi:phosphatidylglycerophosphate synthase